MRIYENQRTPQPQIPFSFAVIVAHTGRAPQIQQKNKITPFLNLHAIEYRHSAIFVKIQISRIYRTSIEDPSKAIELLTKTYRTSIGNLSKSIEHL